jgi:hypothetical protein
VQQARHQLTLATRNAANLHHDVKKLVNQIVNVHDEAQLRDEERVALNTFVTAAEREVQVRRASLNTDSQRDFDVRRQLAEAQHTLDDLTREQVALLGMPTEVKELENLPTPLAQTVSGEEVHLRLNDGYVAFIPLDELITELKTDAEQNLWRLKDRDVADGVVGPRNGFRMRYRLRQRHIVLRAPNGAVQQGTVTQVARWQLVPESARLGEPVDEAVRPTSDLMHLLRPYRPAATTVTVWTYTNSFDDFRKIKERLFELGFASAARPLPDGELIGGSPHGSKSAAQ